MQATRRGRAFRAAVILVVGIFALGIFETTTARSNGAPAPSAPVAGAAAKGKLTKAERLSRKARGLVLKGLRRVDRKHPCRVVMRLSA